MKLTHPFRCAVAIIAAAFVLPGCSTSQPGVTIVDFRPIPLAEASPELAALFAADAAPRYVSLGAGDALGRAVYVNNIILAARMRSENDPSALADVPDDDGQTP